MKLRAPLSLATILVLFLLLVQVRLWLPYFNTHNVQAVLTWDAMGYYLYLPAHFIYHDLSRLAFIPDIMREYSPTGSFYQAYPAPGGPASGPGSGTAILFISDRPMNPFRGQSVFRAGRQCFVPPRRRNKTRPG